MSVDPAGLGWRSCFLINLPVGDRRAGAGAAGHPRVAPAGRARARPARHAARHGGSDRGRAAPARGAPARLAGHGPWLSLAAAPVLLAGFVVHQRRLARRGGSPLLDMSLFGHRSFSAGLLTQLCFWAGQASFFVVLALYLQNGRGMHPLPAGLVFTILAAAYVAASMRAPGLAARHGRAVIAVGALVLAARSRAAARRGVRHRRRRRAGRARARARAGRRRHGPGAGAARLDDPAVARARARRRRLRDAHHDAERRQRARRGGHRRDLLRRAPLRLRARVRARGGRAGAPARGGRRADAAPAGPRPRCTCFRWRSFVTLEPRRSPSAPELGYSASFVSLDPRPAPSVPKLGIRSTRRRRSTARRRSPALPSGAPSGRRTPTRSHPRRTPEGRRRACPSRRWRSARPHAGRTR